MLLARTVLAAILVFGGTALAEEGKTEKALEATGLKESAPKVSSADQEFITKAAEGGMAEVAMAKLAQTKAQGAEVKSFAEKMVADHTKANDKLTAIAKAKDSKLPSGPNADQKRKMDELEKLSGAAFDGKYMTIQVEAHQQMHDLMNRQAETGKDAELKAFAMETLTTVKEHHALAKQLSKPQE
jgi:putative membrane protein